LVATLATLALLALGRLVAGTGPTAAVALGADRRRRPVGRSPPVS
jgi:hypothetical protein